MLTLIGNNIIFANHSITKIAIGQNIDFVHKFINSAL
jgi:hypothetical protein